MPYALPEHERTYQREFQRRWRAANVAAGRCRDCGHADRIIGTRGKTGYVIRRCASCLDRKAKTDTKHQNTRRRAQICATCPRKRPAGDRHRECAICRRRRRVRRLERIRRQAA